MPTLTQEVDLEASAPKLWAALKDSPVLLPKLVPQLFSSIEPSGGETKVGTERVVKFGSVAPEGAFVKEKILALDHDNFTLTTEEVAGGHLNQGFTKWVSTLKFVPVDDKSSKLHASVDYEGENEPTLARAKEGFVKVFKGLTSHINSSGAYA